MTVSQMLPADFDVEEVLQSLTSVGFNGIPHKGIPAVRLADGPNGPRGVIYYNGPPSNLYPCSMALAASFDRELMREISEQMVEACRVKKMHVLLGPAVNLTRNPLAGRGFEYPGEDPLLAGELAAVYINTIEAGGVMTSLKHFACNEQEYGKHRVDHVISERTLREIYLEPFRVALSKSSPQSIMSAYNKINGIHCSEHQWLLTDVLRNEWGYKGTVISDWYGTHSSDVSLKAGLDVEMPEPCFRGPAQMLNLMECGKITERDVDPSARRVLQMVKRAIQSGIPFEDDEGHIDTLETRALLRKSAASSVVLLKHADNTLPLDPTRIKTLAVIGGAANDHHTSGDGAASVHIESHRSTLLDGIVENAREDGLNVQYTVGSQSYRYTPIIPPKYLTHPEGPNAAGVAAVDFWKTEPSALWRSVQGGLHIEQEPDHSVVSKTAKCFMLDGAPRHIITDAKFVRFKTTFKPPRSGDWQFGFVGVDEANIFLDGKLLIDYKTDLEPGSLWFTFCHKERISGVIRLEADHSYDLEIRCWATAKADSLPVKIPAGFQIGIAPIIDPDNAIAEAVELSASCDATVVVVGLGRDYEGEGQDRTDIELPGEANRLVDAVLTRNPNAIIVVQSGMPVVMPWIEKAKTLIQGFYGGTMVGHGLADVIFGKVNPSAKLPMTFPKKYGDVPSAKSFGDRSYSGCSTAYSEGIYVGYRHYNTAGIDTLFPFGHGLSYTTFEYSDITASVIDRNDNLAKCDISFRLKNTGSRPGKEIIQVYVRDREASLPRPFQELKAFNKIALEIGETKTVKIQLDRNAFKFWDDRERQGSWLAEAGDFGVAVGASSTDIRLETNVSLPKNLRWLGL